VFVANFGIFQLPTTCENVRQLETDANELGRPLVLLVQLHEPGDFFVFV
jgi:hypothetical protein